MNSRSQTKLKEYLKVAEKLAKRNNGILPCTTWLRANGYKALDRCMKTYPDKFKHIKRESTKGNTPEQWLKIAEKLTKKNNGTLPNAHWLTQNGYWGLYKCIRRYPKIFKHVKQIRIKRTTSEEWVKIAKKLARRNKGKLPGHQWLINNGYKNLYNCSKKNPDKFRHLNK